MYFIVDHFTYTHLAISKNITFTFYGVLTLLQLAESGQVHQGPSLACHLALSFHAAEFQKQRFQHLKKNIFYDRE